MATNEISGREYNQNHIIRARRNWKWPFKDIEDPEYKKERDEFFESNGNGWWVQNKSRPTK